MIEYWPHIALLDAHIALLVRGAHSALGALRETLSRKRARPPIADQLRLRLVATTSDLLVAAGQPSRAARELARETDRDSPATSATFAQHTFVQDADTRRSPSHVPCSVNVFTLQREKGRAMNTRHTVVDTTLGSITIVAGGDAITGLYFRHHIRRPAEEIFGPEVGVENDPLLADAATQLHEYLNGGRHDFDLRFDAAGDAFQHAVWSMVAGIPFGETTTYGAIAQRLGDKSLSFRVGQAVGANPLCIFVPCHRVVGSNGKLTGYAGGLKRKQTLLELEEPAQVSARRLF